MIVEYIRYKIDEPRRVDFEKAHQDAGAALDVSSHCHAYELTHCTEAAESYILRIEWDSEEGHLKGFRASPEFKPVFAAIQLYVKDIEEMRHYQLTSVKNRK